MELTGTNWELVDRGIFDALRFASIDELAAEYYAEAMRDESDDVRLVTLYEMGQRLFSHTYNSRTARESLFMQRIQSLAKAAANA